MGTILQERVQRSKQYEVRCYSICYYLLQEETLAIKAAQEVMTRLIQDFCLIDESEPNIEQFIKLESIKQSIYIINSKR